MPDQMLELVVAEPAIAAGREVAVGEPLVPVGAAQRQFGDLDACPAAGRQSAAPGQRAQAGCCASRLASISKRMCQAPGCTGARLGTPNPDCGSARGASRYGRAAAPVRRSRAPAPRRGRRRGRAARCAGEQQVVAAAEAQQRVFAVAGEGSCRPGDRRDQRLGTGAGNTEAGAEQPRDRSSGCSDQLSRQCCRRPVRSVPVAATPHAIARQRGTAIAASSTCNSSAGACRARAALKRRPRRASQPAAVSPRPSGGTDQQRASGSGCGRPAAGQHAPDRQPAAERRHRDQRQRPQRRRPDRRLSAAANPKASGAAEQHDAAAAAGS